MPVPQLIADHGLPVKQAAVADAGMAALVAALLGRSADSIPVLAQLKVTNPTLYTALFGASLMASVDALKGMTTTPQQEGEKGPHAPLVHHPGYVV